MAVRRRLEGVVPPRLVALRRADVPSPPAPSEQLQVVWNGEMGRAGASLTSQYMRSSLAPAGVERFRS